MPQLIRSPDAADDVVEIASYIAQDSQDAALRWMKLIDEKVRKLSDFPGIGAERDDLGPGLRSLPVGNYLIVYRAIDDGIEVVRILHGARNLRWIFKRR